jgi:Lrp/AsnC family leucine-responsive transcriptional regulator
MVEIDKIDRKILSILQGDGRIANVELAERISCRQLRSANG